jgi:hypothetical protein
MSYDSKVHSDEYTVQSKSLQTTKIEYPKKVLFKTDISYFTEDVNVTQPLEIKAEIPFIQKSKATIVPDQWCSSNLFRPDGTESWYIHEIKPQRKLLQLSISPNASKSVQHKPVEHR